MSREAGILRFCLSIFMLLVSCLLSAGAQPKFTLLPLTPTTVPVPIDGTATVSYQVTNHTKITRTLKITPITGITQVTQGVGVCQNLFTLAEKQSCTLILKLEGSKLPAKVLGGPEVCKATPVSDAFLCSQPSAAASLNITVIIPPKVTLKSIAVTPENKSIIAGASLQYTATGTYSDGSQQNITSSVTWTSSNTTAATINATGLVMTSSSSQTSSASTTITATLGLLSNSTGLTVNPNTALISVSGSPLILFPGYPTLGGISGVLTITNNSSTLTATHIIATLPGDWSDVTQDASDCLTLLPGAHCTLKFTSSSLQHPTIAAPITGDNTTTVSAALTVNLAWATNISVGVILPDPSTNRIYLGGAFTYVGPNTSNGVPLDSTTGQPLAAFPRTNNFVNVAITDGNGGWYIGGSFTSIDGMSQNHVAHILPDYTIDPAFNGNVNGAVNTLLLNGNTLYVGGTFTLVGGQNRTNLAAIDSSTGIVNSWVADATGGASPAVFSLALSSDNSTLHVGGLFTTVSGQPRSNIAAVDTSSGAASSWNPNANGRVQALVLSSDGSTLYTGGNFSTIGGQTRSRIAALDTVNGSASLTWNPNANNIVFALALNGSTLYAGGSFTNIGGQVRNNIAAVDATITNTGTANSWNPNATGTVSTIAISGSTVYAGGNFTAIGGQNRNFIAALNATSGISTAWNPVAGSSVSTIALNGSTVYAGGTFTSIGGQLRNHLAALDMSTGVVTPWDPNADNTVSSFALSGNTLYVGGSFNNIGGLARPFIAGIDTTSGQANPALNFNADNTVSSLALGNGILYVGGNFATIGGAARKYIAAIDTSTGLAITPWNTNAAGDSNVVTVALDGNTLYTGGTFSNIGGASRNSLAALNATTGNATSWTSPLATGSNVSGLALNSDTLYIGGNFTFTSGAQTYTNIAALDRVTGSPILSWTPDTIDGPVAALALQNSTLYVGGTFTTIGGQARLRLAALNASTGAVLNWNPTAANSVFALAFGGSSVYVGGLFQAIDTQTRPRFAILPPFAP